MMVSGLLSLFLIVIAVCAAYAAFHHNPPQCGIPQIAGNELILNGLETSPGDWPWHVAIYHRKGRSMEFACGGSIINEQFVLTAAHCIMNTINGFQLAPNRIVVRMGIHDLNVVNPKSVQQHEVGKIHAFANFTRFIDDIALIHLSTIIQFNDYVQPVCVNLEPNITGEYGTVVGWGLTEDDDVSTILRKVDMPVIDPIVCLKSDRTLFGQTLDDGLFCAGFTNGTAVCNGDSGGGIFFKRANTWFLGGIVSFSQTRSDGTGICHSKGYGAFTKVEKYLSWISGISQMKFVRDSDVRTCKAIDPLPGESYPNHLPRHCGVYIPDRITGGKSTRVFEFPWMAIILHRNMQFLCLGTLIHVRYILTVASCIRNPLPNKVRLGEHTMGQDKDCNDGNEDCAPPVRDYGIECIITHPRFTFPKRHHDIALIRLGENVILEDHIQPICLPHSAALRHYQPPRYIVAGWGLTDLLGKLSPVLQKGTVMPGNRSECQEWLNGLRGEPQLAEGQLCLGGGNDSVDTCAGDSGGPLGYGAKLHGVRFVQFGITSLGNTCGYVPTIFTDVTYYMDWILANMRE
ncbi:transmembrane protease serine 9-like [Sabethes cyaneus]|uniref:transmembrane protease serine 9-like n=1 Tax=Sabethes cyaneus TaxID=53552 RepID=UPI00237D557C|nr:transmembrane protease serine 9-like [Sabethes cyaneus]